MTTFKVKEVSKYISNILRRDSFLSNISVEGEVSNFKKSGGHSYFSIKDDEAVLKCVVFKTVPVSYTHLDVYKRQDIQLHLNSE